MTLLTERDEYILQFINTFGFCEIRHIQKEVGLKKRQSYSVMERLINGGLVSHQRIYHQQNGIYFLTRNGAAQTNLPALNNINRHNYRHHLTVIDIYQRLKQQYPDMVWISERMLLHEKFTEGLGQKGHISDGLFLLDNKKIVIEVELTVKGKARLEKIIKGYAGQMDIDEVLYFCAKKTFTVLQPLVEKMQAFIKTILLDEFLYESTQ